MIHVHAEAEKSTNSVTGRIKVETMDFRLVPSERGLEAVGKSVDLHIIGRSKAFDLFPRTHKGKNRCILREKHALINSRERTRIWLHT